jgi:hypothetical protein
MNNEINQSDQVVSETDSDNYAKISTPEQADADGGISDSTEGITPEVASPACGPTGWPQPCLVKGRKRKLDLLVGRRYVLPDKDGGEGAHLLLAFNEFAEGVYRCFLEAD